MEDTYVQSEVKPINEIFVNKYNVDFYQREYVWGRKQIEDLIDDLSNEFLKNYKTDDDLEKVESYSPYYMGEIVLSTKPGNNAIIDGQQRITSITLLLIYMLRTFGKLESFPKIQDLIYKDNYGKHYFNLDIPERNECMLSLFTNGEYDVKDTDTLSVHNIVDRYSDIADCWRSEIDETNVVHFAYWVINKIVFSKVHTNSDDFAYIIFETMNDRGLSLTQTEMLRSYLLANIEISERDRIMKSFDDILKRLSALNNGTKSRHDIEFFKMYLRSHYAETMSQNKNADSDFTKIGQAFHRWVRDNENLLNLRSSKDFVDFTEQMIYFAKQYIKIIKLINERNASDYFYLIVNSDFDFSMQPAIILAGIKYGDSDEIVNEKIQLISKYMTKVIAWRVWCHWNIHQSALEAKIYALCQKIRNMSTENIKLLLENYKMDETEIDNSPTLNKQNRKKLKVLLALITEIVARHSGESNYMLNKPNIEVEHIWADHFERHTDEFANKEDFAHVRNNIGDLLVLKKPDNASYNDAVYEDKVKQYFSQNILAQSLNKEKYVNNPGFNKFRNESKLPFKAYESFTKSSINERADLYRQILKYEFKEFLQDNNEVNE